MSARSDGKMAGLPDLLRSRLRVLLPLGLISVFGLSAYWVFCSLTSNGPGPGVDRPAQYRLGSVGSPDISRTVQNDSKPATPPNVRVYESDQLMSLPVLHHTFNDPFDQRNGFKPLRDSKSPWKASDPAVVMLINRLSRNRSPPADSVDASRGSSPPPPPPWPPRRLLKEKAHSHKTPIPKHLIPGLNISYVWENRERVKDGQLPKVQWAGFDKLNWETDSDRSDRLERQGWVRRGFQHVWEGYKARAWGHDELKPISGSFQDPFSGWGATLVDCLDTLLIMNLTQEYNYARTHVKAIDWAHTIDQTYSTTPPKISFFETVIRYMGGLISAYDLSGDDLMLARAEELAEWLMPAFGTSSGLPLTHYQIGSIAFGEKTGRVCLADIGSLTLEFTRLSQLTRKGFYYDVVQKITDLLDGDQWTDSSRLGTLLPILVDPQHPHILSGKYTFGAMADSYYEYLIKQYQLLRGTNLQYSKMYKSAIESARRHLIRTYDLEPSGGKNLTVIGDISWGMFTPSLDHLTCFAGAMIGLGSQLLDRKQDLDLALGHVDACVWAYESTKTGVGPEQISIIEGDERTRWQSVFYEGQTFRELKSSPSPGASILDGRYHGRPETIESVYYMWRITGDRQWQDRGWRMFTSWMEASTTSFGFADLNDVNEWPPHLSDKQESYVLAETFKYYYLLFSDPELISLDDFVFNTEAHPFRLETPEKPLKRFWVGPDPALDEIYDPPGTKKDERGFGTFLQQWLRVDLEKISEVDLQVYNKVIGV